MNSSNTKSLLLPALNSVLVVVFYIIISIVFNGKHTYTFPITCIAIYIFIYLKTSNHISFKLIFSSILLLEIIFLSILFFAEDTLGASLIIYCVYLPIVTYLGALTKLKIGYLALFMAFMVLSIIYIKPNWLSYYNNLDSNLNIKFPAVNFSSNDSLKINLNNDIVILDFWTTSCGVCFKKFPEFEKIKLEYQSYPNVRFYSVNVPLDRDQREEVNQLIRKLNYRYETIFAKSSEEVRDSLGINAFPALLILKNDTIRYNGELITDKKIPINNIRTIIDQLRD